MPIIEDQEPQTPITSPRETPLSGYRDSPYSDYFTDDGRPATQKTLQSPQIQELLLRLNNIGAHVLRQNLPTDTIDAIRDLLDPLESAVGWPSRHRLGMHDSGFVDTFPVTSDENRDSHDEPLSQGSYPLTENPPSFTSQGSSSHFSPQDNHISSKKHHHDRLLVDAQTILERVSRANTLLRSRFNQVDEMNEHTSLQLEEANREALSLQSQVEALKADLTFDHTELLFLKLQFKALEVQMEETFEEHEESEALREKRSELEKGAEQWKDLWDDIDTRFRTRREAHRVTSSTSSDLIRLREDGQSTNEGNWKLDMSRKRQGRVQSITLRRTVSEENHDAEHDPDEIDEEVPHPVEPALTISTATIYSEMGTVSLPAFRDVPGIDLLDSEKKELATKAATKGETFPDYEDYNSDDEEEEGDEIEDDSDDDGEDKSVQTPWQELIQSLTEFAGMAHY